MKTCVSFNELRVVNIIMPHGKQEDKGVSPTNSENSTSSGHSSRSSNQTSSTLLSEDSLYDNKNLGNTKLNGKAFYHNEYHRHVRICLLIERYKYLIVIIL
jgi:hypothetical protein